MLRKYAYPLIEGPMKKTAHFLDSQGITPNQLTLAGLVLNFAAGWIFASGNLLLGALVVILAGIGDMLDGTLARECSKATPFGAFLDSVTDRYSDFFIFGGLALHFARTNQGGLLVITLGALAGAYAVSYAKARAENFIPNCGVGIFDRALRIILLLAGCILPVLLPALLWVLFLGSNATAVHRILHTRKILNAPPSTDA
jgi:CDP-diacylglycerol---glycerol-3-phosphate 3-phosphatidyltransferase